MCIKMKCYYESKIRLPLSLYKSWILCTRRDVVNKRIRAVVRLVTHTFVPGFCGVYYLSLSFGLKHKGVAAPACSVRIQQCSNPRQPGRGSN